MALGPHAAFILLAYAAVGVVVLGLVFWTVADHRRQRLRLRDLEDQGITRRSVRKRAQ